MDISSIKDLEENGFVLSQEIKGGEEDGYQVWIKKDDNSYRSIVINKEGKVIKEKSETSKIDGRYQEDYGQSQINQEFKVENQNGRYEKRYGENKIDNGENPPPSAFGIGERFHR